MKEIKLSQTGKNKGKYVALVDDEDYDYLNQWRWCVDVKKNTCYAMRRDKITISLHRVIINTPEGIEVDHIDHNGLNCQKYNMRNCSHADNLKNKKPCGKSKYLGVYFMGKYRYIRAQIQINGTCHYLGHFKTEIEAAKSYDKKAKEVHGEFANLNFK